MGCKWRGFVGRHFYFVGMHCLRPLDLKWRQCVSPKRRYLYTTPHGVTTQKANIDTFSAVRTSELATHHFAPITQIELSPSSGDVMHR